MVTRTRRVDDARRNDRTRLAVDVRALRRPLARADDEKRWGSALERIHAWRAEHPEGNAVAVVVRTDDKLDVVLRQADPKSPTAVVVGRHTSADATLPDDGSGSLRHAAVLCWPSGDGPPRVVAVDLRSEGGIVARDGRIARRMSSTRAVHFGAGSADVFALLAASDEPFPIKYADQLDAELTGALVEERGVLQLPPGPKHRSWEKSVVVRTRLSRGPVPEDAVVVRASHDDVERGLVLGREPRCHRTTALADSVQVSRVHALLLAVDDELWLVDTASTNGTTIITPRGDVTSLGEQQRIARLPLDARVELAGTEVVVVIDG